MQGQPQARVHAAKILVYSTIQVIFPSHGIRDSTNLIEHSREYLQHRKDRVVPIITQENTRDKIHINKQKVFSELLQCFGTTTTAVGNREQRGAG